MPLIIYSCNIYLTHRPLQEYWAFVNNSGFAASLLTVGRSTARIVLALNFLGAWLQPLQRMINQGFKMHGYLWQTRWTSSPLTQLAGCHELHLVQCVIMAALFLQCFLYKRAERSPKEKAKLQQEILDYIFENGVQSSLAMSCTLFAAVRPIYTGQGSGAA